MKILVLGSGVIGVTTAYQLAKRGHEVEVVDRGRASASECSFANGGQLSYAHVEPWATPGLLPKIPKWLLDKNSPLVFNIRADYAMWSWAMKFLACCTSAKAYESTINMMRLALYSKQCFAEIEAETNISYSKISKGTLHTFRNQALMDFNIQQADFQKTLGCDFKVLMSRSACEEIEPALKYSQTNIIGGLYFPIDATGDVCEFSINLATIIKEKGVKFHYGTKISNILVDGDKIVGVKTDKGVLTADKYVVCLGAATPLLLKPIGINLPIYPMKGYSISVKITNSDKAPTVGITDQGNKIVFSRLGDVMRVAGTAEFAGYNDSIKASRIATLKKMAKETFPESGDMDHAGEWACLRPSTPDGSPIIGKTKFNNLILNTGHGTLGWTLSCGSAKAAADIVEGKNPEIDLTGLNTAKYKSALA
ncbi:MAG: Glycine/D-amino acid oxidase [Rickettsiaceae bacterium]|jgi:D-amino-acid dehydrogenase|nr:Glycine/D-amino acid oxidase [Rickettsiaceae bacterium]